MAAAGGSSASGTWVVIDNLNALEYENLLLLLKKIQEVHLSAHDKFKCWILYEIASIN